MFEQLTAAPADPILGLNQLFREDPKAEKVNLSIGVYQDEQGATPSLRCITEADQRLKSQPVERKYLPITGHQGYCDSVRELILGAGHAAISANRCQTIQALGGTGALRVAADTLQATRGECSVWLTDPTWANHHQIFGQAGHRVQTFPWLNDQRTDFDISRVVDQLQKINKGDVLVLHGCCHNPSGVDPDNEQWAQIRQIAEQREALVIFDTAYQGFAEGIETDAAPIRSFAESNLNVWICNSFSKNFSLYNERVGGLTLCVDRPETLPVLVSHAKRCIRANYSNPPANGARWVATVLADTTLREAWLEELAQMRNRILDMREQFATTMSSMVPDRDFSFIARQRGMFSFTGLDPEQVKRLRDVYSVYLVGSGRINLAGLSTGNLERVCQAIASTMQEQPAGTRS